MFSEIGKVRSNLFQINGYVKEPLILPDGNGPPVIHTEKVYVPVKDHPEVKNKPPPPPPKKNIYYWNIKKKFAHWKDNLI